MSVGSDTIEGEIVGVMCIAYTGCSLCKVKLTTTDGVVAECAKCIKYDVK